MPARRLLAASCLLACLLVCLSACFERGDNAPARSRAPTEAPPRTPAAPEPPEPPLELAVAPEGPALSDATITVRLEAEPAHLNPLLAGDAVANRVALGDIYQGLLCQDELAGPARPCLAASVDHDAAAATWTFRLRQGVVWHDGERFGADDVLFTYGLVTGAAVPSWLAADFDDLQSIEVVAAGDDDKAGDTVVMTFASHRLGRREAFARVPILPRHVFAPVAEDGAALLTARANRRPVGTGPLRLVSWTPGASIVVERFARYWGRPAGAGRVVYRVIESRSRALRALAAGTLDVAVQIPVDQAHRAARAGDDIGVFRYRQPAYLAAVYNLRRPALADVRARRGLGMLMDRPTLARTLFGGHARPIAGPYLARDPDRHPALAPLGFDPAAARALLSQAGVTANTALEVLVPAGSRTMARVADIWADDARDAVRLQVTPLAYADVLARLREGRFDVALMAFTTGLDLDLYSRFHSGQSENYGGLSDPALDRALAAVRDQPDPRERRALQRRVQARLHELQPYTFIVGDTRVGLVRADIGGFDHAAAGARGLWRAQ